MKHCGKANTLLLNFTPIPKLRFNKNSITKSQYLTAQGLKPFPALIHSLKLQEDLL